MKTDLYTKIVLTVIAAALVGILAQNVSVTPTAHAQAGTVDVNIVGADYPLAVTVGGTVDVDLVDVSTSRFVPVEIRDIWRRDGDTTVWEAINVTIE